MDRREFKNFSSWSFDLLKKADEAGCTIKVNDRGAIITHPSVSNDLYVRVMRDPIKQIDRHNMERGLKRILDALPKEKTVGTNTPAKPRPVAERCPFCGPLKDGQTISQHNRLHLNGDEAEAIDTLNALRELLGVTETDKQKMDDLERENIRLRQQLQATELELSEIKQWKSDFQRMLQS